MVMVKKNHDYCWETRGRSQSLVSKSDLLMMHQVDINVNSCRSYDAVPKAADNLLFVVRSLARFLVKLKLHKYSNLSLYLI